MNPLCFFAPNACDFFSPEESFVILDCERVGGALLLIRKIVEEIVEKTFVIGSHFMVFNNSIPQLFPVIKVRMVFAPFLNGPNFGKAARASSNDKVNEIGQGNVYHGKA